MEQRRSHQPSADRAAVAARRPAHLGAVGQPLCCRLRAGAGAAWGDGDGALGAAVLLGA